MKIITSLMLFISLIQACTKDKVSPIIEKDCREAFTEIAINHDTTYTLGCPIMFDVVFLHRYNYDRPVFNPNNPNQIAYMRDDTEINGGWNTELWTFDFCTGKANYLTDKAGYGIDWSSKDWLVFTGKDRQIWKIKSNGDSLTQLTNQSGYNNDPKWNDEGTKFIYRWDGASGLLIADENGAIIDTLNVLGGRRNWSKNYLSFAIRGNNNSTLIKLYDFNLALYQEIDFFPKDSLLGNIIHATYYSIKEDLIYWNMRHVIGHTNIQTKERTIIMTGARNRLYIGIDVSPDDGTILVARANTNKINDCLIESETSLYLIDVDGKNERRINIPE